MAELAVEEISVRFGGLQALQDVNLEVHAGAVNGLIGPNGAGKTTLFNVITGLQAAARGHVSLNGTNISSLAPHNRAQRGLARTFQRIDSLVVNSIDDYDGVLGGTRCRIVKRL